MGLGLGVVVVVAGAAVGGAVVGIRGVGDGSQVGVEGDGPLVGVLVRDTGAGESLGLGRRVGVKFSVGSATVPDAA